MLIFITRGTRWCLPDSYKEAEESEEGEIQLIQLINRVPMRRVTFELN